MMFPRPPPSPTSLPVPCRRISMADGSEEGVWSWLCKTLPCWCGRWRYVVCCMYTFLAEENFGTPGTPGTPRKELINYPSPLLRMVFRIRPS